MNSFQFIFDGREYRLRKLTLEAKEDLLDRVTAGRLKQAQRMFKKGYLEAAGFLDAKQGAYVKWGTEAFVTELADEANAASFVRAIVSEPLTDELVAALVAEQRNPESDLAGAIARMAEDDDPKAKAPPGSVPTPTGGAPSS